MAQNSGSSEHYIVVIDVGTTTLRCHVLDSTAKSISVATDKVELLYPDVGHVEIDPEKLWTSVVEVVKEAIKEAGLRPEQITCLGMSTLRSSFVTWDRKTGKPYHNFITWKDTRADKLVRQWNDSLTMKGMRAGSGCLYLLSRSKRFLAGSVLRLMNTQVSMRLLWAFQNVPPLKEAVAEGRAMFGTVDTWLLYRMTGGRLHVTDVSSASATGLYDPFVMDWGDWAFKLFKIPSSIMPEVWDTAGDFGTTSADIWGASIPIRSSVADQSASLFGSCCFNVGDVKVTMGTGTFLDVNTGSSPHASVAGLYPVVGWRIGNELVYVAEGASNDTATVINWAQSIGLIDDPQDTADMAMSIPQSDGVFFVPAFSGLQAPINDFQAATGFIGLKPSTGKPHMVRAILESITFRVLQLYQVLLKEANFEFSHIRVDGGVSRNDFVTQLLANITGLKVERPTSTEMSLLGAGFLAGLAAGVWKSKDELKKIRQVEREFEPNLADGAKYQEVFQRWEKAVERLLQWYSVR